MSIQTATQHVDVPDEPNEPDEPYTNSLAYAMFIAGYKARIADETADIKFSDRETFDAHLYDKFQRAYADP